MAAKNKHRKKTKAAKTATFEPEDKDMEAENGGGDEEGDSGADGGEGRPDEGGDEFNLEEVLRLGGTQVCPVEKS